MKLAHQLLALISDWTEEEIKVSFNSWFEECGRKLLSMDHKSARNQRAGMEAGADEFIEEPPQATP